MLHETGQGTRNSSVGHLDTKHFQTLKPGQGLLQDLSIPKQSPKSQETEELTRSVLYGVKRFMQRNEAEQLTGSQGTHHTNPGK